VAHLELVNMSRVTKEQIKLDFQKLGIQPGDTILIRATLSEVGRLASGADMFIDALLESVGIEGTIVSLAFTSGSAGFKTPRKEDAFNLSTKSYAGSLPNSMISREDSHRSAHPMCSFVGIGKNAKAITENHNALSPAYEPVRKIIELNGKCILVGCVKNSPGFTTTHLAEADLGYLNRLPVFPWLRSVYYEVPDGGLKLFRRKDPGMCSNSFYKFYALYVKEGILSTGFIGKAYSILAPAKECYEIDRYTLKKNQKFNICDSPVCWTCNVGRWDRIHRAPIYYAKKFVTRIFSKIAR
jgi:aminoglycoside N3'-acetyltransferase